MTQKRIIVPSNRILERDGENDASFRVESDFNDFRRNDFNDFRQIDFNDGGNVEDVAVGTANGSTQVFKGDP